MNISGCIITDGANLKNLKNCIKSIYTSCDEIIIGANNNSFEKVTKALKKYSDKCNIFEQTWENDFGKARNETISKAKGEYILVIDSDEILMTEIGYLDKSYDVYSAKIRHDADADILEDGFTQDESMRLFRNCKEIYYTNKIHESIEPQTKGMKICYSDIIFKHSGYVNFDVMGKLKRNQDILLTDPDNNIKDYLFMRHYHLLNKPELVIEHATKVLSLDKYPPTFKSIACLFMGITYELKYKSMDMARQAYSSALFFIPKQIQSRWLLVNSFFNAKEYKAKNIILSQIKAIEDISKENGSQIPNDLYINKESILKIKNEVIKKWQ